MVYGDLHRFYLRTMASQGVLSVHDVRSILNKFIAKAGNEEYENIDLQTLFKDVNDAIRPFKQEIKLTNDEVTNEEVMVFLSLGYDEITKSQNIFSAKELEFFRLLIEQIMTTESRQITGINAMNLVNKITSTFTKSDAQKMLDMWTRMRYLDQEQGNYALGVRGIHEFEGYFRQHMPDTIEDCCLCKKIVFRGYNCPGCALAVHTRCLKLYLRKVEKWPCCKIDYREEQIDRLNNDGSRLTQTQHLETTQQSVAYNTIVKPTLTQDVSQETRPSQTHKRKRGTD